LIVPPLLKRVWEIDNPKSKLLWEIGQLGGVSGDCFIKVAYEDPFVDPSGMLHPGRVRILPINPAFAFPEFHPHDRTRLIRFKLKYKFWGTAQDGTRQVYTYVELLTEQGIEEYVNDELIDRRENPLGVIPVIHIPNIPVASSPWGLSDIQDIIGLNREYNEKATEVSDIINYHSAPVTVIIGAKAGLERVRTFWAIPNKDADPEPPTGGNLRADRVLERPPPCTRWRASRSRPRADATGVHTSGVALHMTYSACRSTSTRRPSTRAFGRINDLVIRHIAIYEPEMMAFSPYVSAVKPGPTQYPIDPNDPVASSSRRAPATPRAPRRSKRSSTRRCPSVRAFSSRAAASRTSPAFLQDKRSSKRRSRTPSVRVRSTSSTPKSPSSRFRRPA
jgi:hypothetical protein